MKLSVFSTLAMVALVSAFPYEKRETTEADCVKPYLCCGELKTPLDSTLDPILMALGLLVFCATPMMTLARLSPSAAPRPTFWVVPLLWAAPPSSPLKWALDCTGCLTRGCIYSVLHWHTVMAIG